ncbi:MAG: methyltransferase domain-containing protein [Crocinitomicaceae bacterium]
MKKEFWDSRWENNQIGWDLEQVSPPIKAYIDQLENKTIKILIPGCGNAYEAEYLYENGFKNVFIVEISNLAVQSFMNRYPAFPKNHIFNEDFFDFDEQFDMVLEQTFFCAIDPSRRNDYVKKMSQLLKPQGKVVGVLFNRNFPEGPPFGGNAKEYKERFEKFFTIKTIEECYNSIQPRQGSEVFINLQVK